MFKRIIFIITVLVTCNGVFAQVFEVNGVTFEVLLKNGAKNVTVKGIDENLTNVLELPAVVVHNSLAYRVVEIANDAFKFSDKLTKVILPISIKKIGDGAFMNCINLQEINLPDSIMEIGAYAFESCEKLTKIYVPNSIRVIGDFTFARCLSLREVWLSTSLSILGNDVFRDCESLTTIKIPNSVYKIGDDIFYNCSNLKTISVDYLKPISVSGFNSNLSNVTLRVPKGTATLFKNAPVWREFGQIIEIFEEAGLALKK